MQKQLPENIHAWLNNRGISDTIIELYEIGWNGKQIVLPVHSLEGIHLFNKYRRDPENNSESIPKYTYDFGSKVSLYGLKTFNKEINSVVITEGEMDALCLMSMGIQAVSSTGGAGTFKPEWATYFEGMDVSICYDNDEAGIRGAFHVQSILPNAKIIWLPKQVGEHGDVTDFFIKLGNEREDFEAIRETATNYLIPIDWRECKTRKELKDMSQMYKRIIDGLMSIAREMRELYLSDRHIQILIEMYATKYDEVTKAIKHFQNPKINLDRTELERAKSVSIARFINFNNQRYARCVWHEERTASMYFYERQRRVKCFGCNRIGDVVDVVQAINKCSFKEAINIILNK